MLKVNEHNYISSMWCNHVLKNSDGKNGVRSTKNLHSGTCMLQPAKIHLESRKIVCQCKIGFLVVLYFSSVDNNLGTKINWTLFNKLNSPKVKSTVFPKAHQPRNLCTQILKTKAAPLVKDRTCPLLINHM